MYQMGGMMFRLTDEEIKEVADYPWFDKSRDDYYDIDDLLRAQVKKIADKIEDMANDGDSVGDALKALREET